LSLVPVTLPVSLLVIPLLLADDGT
jgi:hypothetical protein